MEKRFAIIMTPQGVWDATKSYGANAVVSTTDYKKMYVSRQAVPAGTELTNTSYWKICMDLSDVSSAMLTQTEDCKTQTAAALTATQNAETAANNANNAVISDDVRIVVSEALARLKADLETLKALINDGELGTVHATSLTSDDVPKVCGMPMILVGQTAPTTVPDFTGQIYIDVVAAKAYIGTYTSTVSNWKQINNA
jgi:hypothetical protein